MAETVANCENDGRISLGSWADVFPAAQNTLRKKKDRKHRFTFLALITPPALRHKNTLTTRKSKTTINGEYQKSICETKELELLSDPEGFQKVESSFSRLRNTSVYFWRSKNLRAFARL
ncbi:hypothetical protein TNCT_38561 [Trichonephila clavata]|uniref:Uncharacterized protein n=1 Tax=Trichonephila clavata TaxID=2740835 RepID=A0A8X6GUN1_TRICU|nr:hypothetical protein TNCT_38561 [Trichonephila clavata]